MGVPGSIFIDLAINCAGDAYSYNIVNDVAYRINLTTGTATWLGTIGFDANYGQGMAFDKQDGTLYLMAYNNRTTQQPLQLRTMNLNTGSTTLVANCGFSQIAPFDIKNTCVSLIGPGPATNPNPSNGAVNIQISLPTITWQNPASSIGNQTYFGTSPGSLTLVQTGTLATSWDVMGGPLNYSTTYYWRIDEIDTTGTTTGQLWSFSTVQSPIFWGLFYDDFENGTGQWTITNNGGTCDWQIFTPPYPNTYTLPFGSSGGVFSADVDECGNGTTLLSTATFKDPVNTIGSMRLYLRFLSDWNAMGTEDSCFVEASINGTNWDRLLTYGSVDVRNSVVELSLAAYQGVTTLWIRFISIQPGWDWWWAIDNVLIDGTIEYPSEVMIEIDVPKVYSLDQNYPNPFNPSTKINYNLPTEAKVTLKVFDVLGQEIMTLLNSTINAGSHEVTFDASNLNSGVYFYTIDVKGIDGTNFVSTKKMILTK